MSRVPARSALLPWLLFLLVPGLASPGRSQEAPPTLVIGTKPAEPFVIAERDGSWSGISIELWEEIAERRGWDYEYRETDLQGLLDGVANGSLDFGVAAVTATAERESQVDFSHPIHSTGLGIAVPTHGSSWLAMLRAVLSPAFLSVVGLLLLLLLVVGVLAWAVERRANPEQFGGTPLHGIGSGLWWSAVTMTTVGYGDKAPTTLVGRILGLVWMFAGIIVISTFTAAIASSLTTATLASGVEGPADLQRARVGTLEGSAPATSLDRRGIPAKGYPDLEAALADLAAGNLDAVVYDAPILLWEVKRDHPGELMVLPRTFDRQDYGIVMPRDGERNEAVNRELLDVIRSREWEGILQRYLGSP